MDTMNTVSEVLSHLKEIGYTEDFNLEEGNLVCSRNALRIHPEDFEVDKHYRFEGMSDPADEAVVYAISSEKFHIKGTVVNGYGIYSDPATDNILRTLHEKSLHAGSGSQGAKTPKTSGILSTQNVQVTKKDQIPDQVKFNEATPLRPEGDRPLDAPMIDMDLNAFKIQIKREKPWLEGDRNAITIFKTNVMRIVLVALHKGTEMKQHSTNGVISVQVLEGHISFRTGMQTADLKVGQMIALHAQIPHSVYAHEESLFLLTLAKTAED
jgi:quercetin dioxygenase-like cupin family protein